MFNSEKNIYLKESEIKPNKYTSIVLVFLVSSMIISLVANETGLFRVGTWEMRIGAGVPSVISIITLLILNLKKSLLSKTQTKYVLFVLANIITLSIHTMITFHTTMMLLFPIFLALLFRSKKIGIIAIVSSITLTAVCPILSYVLHLWDIPLFEELILIATNGTTIIEGATNTFSWIAIYKIFLYIVFPRWLMVGACSFVMMYVIKRGIEHMEYQIQLDVLRRRDFLTKLYNQNYYKEILADEKKAGSLGLIFFDVNNLKKINDEFGHERGDVLLSRCAKSIIDICTEDEACGFRIGGDEFLFVLEGATEESLNAKFELWKVAMDKINEENKIEYENLDCSMAYGIAFGEMKDFEQLVNEADKKMYEKKKLMKLN